jgi:hypothetical protein
MKKINCFCFFGKILGAALALAAGLLLFTVILPAAPPDGLPSVAHPKIKAAIAVQEAVTPNLMALENILGTAVSMDYDGEAHMVVYVNLEGKEIADTVRSLPKKIKDLPVVVEITEPFRAMLGKPDPTATGKVSHTAKQTPPIQLGTSGGWRYDLANGYCCGGTLGALVNIGSVPFILSNYHVFESDIVAGGNGIIAATGNLVIQPGLIDVNCNAAGAQNVGTLVKKSSLPSNNVDVSVAQVASGMVRSDGAILEIGTISKDIMEASVGQGVKKSGRTTGLTSSTVSALNATISVAYENECAGGAAFTKTFTGQIVISNKGSRFLNSGDSGSLMVENVSTNPRAIGLLYAGSSSTAIANPIGEVLSFLGATMVGK